MRVSFCGAAVLVVDLFKCQKVNVSVCISAWIHVKAVQTAEQNCCGHNVASRYRLLLFLHVVYISLWLADILFVSCTTNTHNFNSSKQNIVIWTQADWMKGCPNPVCGYLFLFLFLFWLLCVDDSCACCRRVEQWRCSRSGGACWIPSPC